MVAPEPPPEPPIDLRRGRGRNGAFRLVRGARPPEVARLPAWARAGWWLPLRTEAVLAIVAVACALVGGGAFLGVVYAPEILDLWARLSRSARG